MTVAAPLAFPGSRPLAGWWQQLAPFRPRALWVAHLLLHRVEALVGLGHTCRADRFPLLLLEALARRPGSTPESLDPLLPLGPQLLHQVLRRQEADGLARPDPAGRWEITPLGREALERGEFKRAAQERRTFTFLHDEQPGRPARYLNVPPSAAGARPAGEGWTFDVAELRACIGRPAEWKERHGFPREVEEVLLEGAPEWQRVVVDHPELLVAVLGVVPAEAGGDRLVGFAVRPEGWSLSSEPVFEVGPHWPEVFPELAEGLPLPSWRQALRAWYQQRGLSAGEAETCPLERNGVRLRVSPSRVLFERLRAMRSDALKGEAWLLAGEGRRRAAALLELVEPAGGAPRNRRAEPNREPGQA